MNNKNLVLHSVMSPCKDCTKREVGCHGKCEDYTEFREALDKRNAEQRKQLAIRESLHDGARYRGEAAKALRRRNDI